MKRRWKARRRDLNPLMSGFDALTFNTTSQLAEVRRQRSLTVVRAQMDPRIMWENELQRMMAQGSLEEDLSMPQSRPTETSSANS